MAMEMVIVKVVDGNGAATIFSCPVSMNLGELFAFYRHKVYIGEDVGIFLFNGKKIEEADTAESINIKQLDVINFIK